MVKFIIYFIGLTTLLFFYEKVTMATGIDHKLSAMVLILILWVWYISYRTKRYIQDFSTQNDVGLLTRYLEFFILNFKRKIQ